MTGFAGIVWAILGIVLKHYTTTIPGFAVLIRRLHDVNKSGWVVLIPLAGAIWLLVLLYKRGTLGANKYSQNVD